MAHFLQKPLARYSCPSALSCITNTEGSRVFLGRGADSEHVPISVPQQEYVLGPNVIHHLGSGDVKHQSPTSVQRNRWGAYPNDFPLVNFVSHRSMLPFPHGPNSQTGVCVMDASIATG